MPIESETDRQGHAPARGVLTFCYGPDPKHLRQAKALARSIRLRNRDIPLAVASDQPPDTFEGLFDRVIAFDFAPFPGTMAKLEMAAITPFETTLFVDADCLCLRDIAAVFDFFGNAEFAVFGANLPQFHWADGSDRIAKLLPAPDYPAFNGGLYFFRRSALATAVFAKARDFSADYDALGLNRPRGRHNDELLISLAMAALKLRAASANALVPMVAPELPARDLELDVLAGHCRFARRGQMVEPAIVHFVGPRDRLPAYRREQWALKLIAGAGWPRWTRSLLGLAAEAAHFAGRVQKRLAKAF